MVCTEITDNDGAGYDPLPTYSISRDLGVDDNVNIYDGARYNTYTSNTVDYKTYFEAEDKSDYKLVEFPTFTL